MGKTGPEEKPFDIPKRLVWRAWLQVKANQGAAGVDGQSVEQFETDLQNNLYKVWNRMSSGSYFPPAVRAVEIPKPHGGGMRMLGVPTVADRVAQTAVALALEPRTESIFHDDSYGYRPKRGALDAVAKCRQRCWYRDWVIDLDVEKFFDSVDHDLMVKAVQANVTEQQRWIVLYVKRWLTAPILMPDGELRPRDRGTPQGSAVSPVLANLFMHYAFDSWLEREFPTVQFERYADDAVVHCVNERQARNVLAALESRMEQVGLRLHPNKTRIVYCKDGKRRLDYEDTSFTFLGYDFRVRTVATKDKKSLFCAFLPAISKAALKDKAGWSGPGEFIYATPLSWRNWPPGSTRSSVAGWPITGGSAGSNSNACSNASTPTCCGGRGGSSNGFGPSSKPGGGGQTSPGDNRGCSRIGHGGPSSHDGLDKTSGVTGDRHAPFCGSPGVRFPRATRQLIGPAAGSAPAVFGRFEATNPNELWCGDALHGPRVGDRKTYLFAFIDDHSRLLVGYRFGFAEDTVRLAAALRPALAARGVPASIYVDYAEVSVMPRFARTAWSGGVEAVKTSA